MGPRCHFWILANTLDRGRHSSLGPSSDCAPERRSECPSEWCRVWNYLFTSVVAQIWKSGFAYVANLPVSNFIEMAKHQPSCVDFKKESYRWKGDVDYRKHPELYRIGKGEQGVLTVEPYKSEIGQHWRFKTPQVAEESAGKIFSMFQKYLKERDFVGADMAKKYLNMGFTRSRRYANWKGGKKWTKSTGGQDKQECGWRLQVKGSGSAEKAECAEIFKKYFDLARADKTYLQMKEMWKKEIEGK
ncbi:uncharacterized protein [Ptychodera flava]|uniref:uncharacterized protein n=1 Tax=Ptychodera flava TaxID=63121 RepID=UPI00396A747F